LRSHFLNYFSFAFIFNVLTINKKGF